MSAHTATSTVNVSGVSLSNIVVTASASASAESTLSYEDALNMAVEIATRTANLQLQTDIRLIDNKSIIIHPTPSVSTGDAPSTHVDTNCW